MTFDAPVPKSHTEVHSIESNTINYMETKRLEAVTNFGAENVLNPDGTPLLDHMNNPIPIAKMLATKPLRSELASRPGPGNKRLTYLSGDSVTRTLNDIFGFDGWCMEIKSTTREECVQDDKGRYHVTYTAFVRVTHRRSGAFKEDCGSGDAVDKVMGVAISHALKASVTDAMKRAVRHFGDKLGNSLYQDTFNINKAPSSLTEALNMYETERANTKFGFKIEKAPCSAMNSGEPAQNIDNGAKSTLLESKVTMKPSGPYVSSSNASNTSSNIHQQPIEESTILADSYKENSQTNCNSNEPARTSNYTAGLPRFQLQQTSLNVDMSLVESYQKMLTATKQPLTSLQMLQESTNASYSNIGMMNDPQSDSSYMPKALYNHVTNPVRMDPASRSRLSLSSSSSKNNMNQSTSEEPELASNKRVLVQHNNQSDLNVSGPSKRLNPYQNGRGAVDLPS